MAASTPGPGDLELLKIQILDPSGRALAGLRGFLIARTAAAEEEEIWIGSRVPEDLARELRDRHRRAGPGDPAGPPPALADCERLLSASGWKTRRQDGPSYVIEKPAHFGSGAAIECSGSPTAERLRRSNPGNWEPIEWNELLAGDLGPWTMATRGNRVISICHTPRPMTAAAAECGVWTDPDFRGRGHAAAVTDAWADMLLPSGRHLFYRTRADNRSSQRVAERLGLRRIGWTWTVAHAEDDSPDAHLHPLSRLRTR
jgi:hypothetical protein